MAGGRKNLEQRRGHGSTHNRTQIDERMAPEASEEDEYDDNDAEDNAGDGALDADDDNDNDEDGAVQCDDDMS